MIPKVREALSAKMNEFPEKNLILENMLQFFPEIHLAPHPEISNQYPSNSGTMHCNGATSILDNILFIFWSYKSKSISSSFLIRATFAFISLVGVTFDIAVVFLELFLLKQLLEYQVHGDRVEWIAGGGNDLVPSVVCVCVKI